LGLTGRVTFAGRVPQDKLPAYYAASDAVVIPSRPPEAFGVSLAQGMAAGKPVIGSDIPGVRTLIREGEQGFLIPIGDQTALAKQILVLAGGPSLRAKMGAAGRERIIQNYTWKAAGAKLLNMYKEVLGMK
jgi:glycosyltransferase involved in cell wall biosynthesis